MIFYGLLSFVLISASYALPTWTYSTSSWCAGLGAGAFDTAQNFTLAAYNRTSTNANSTGAPLVLSQSGATDGAEYRVLSTYATYPYDEVSWPSFSLLGGALIPNPSANNSGMSAVDVNFDDGSEPCFIISSQDDLPEAAQIYCAVADTDPSGGSPYAALAVNGTAGSFSLCMSGTGATVQNNIVYKATPDNSGAYDYDSCYPVRVQLIGLD